MDPSQLTEFLVFITVRAGHEEEFVRGAFANQAGSIKEPGSLRFDMYRNAENPREFLFAEKYTSVESVTLHRQSQHFLEFFKMLEVAQEFPRRREAGSVIPENYKPIGTP